MWMSIWISSNNCCLQRLGSYLGFADVIRMKRVNRQSHLYLSIAEVLQSILLQVLRQPTLFWPNLIIYFPSFDRVHPFLAFRQYNSKKRRFNREQTPCRPTMTTVRETFRRIISSYCTQYQYDRLLCGIYKEVESQMSTYWPANRTCICAQCNIRVIDSDMETDTTCITCTSSSGIRPSGGSNYQSSGLAPHSHESEARIDRMDVESRPAVLFSNGTGTLPRCTRQHIRTEERENTMSDDRRL